MGPYLQPHSAATPRLQERHYAPIGGKGPVAAAVADSRRPGHIHSMRLNSQRALELGRQLFEKHGGDWSRVQASGHVCRDGVIDLTGEAEAKTANQGKDAVGAAKPQRAA